MTKSIPTRRGGPLGSAIGKPGRGAAASAAARPETVRRGRGRPKLMSDEQQAAAIAREARDLFLEKGYARTPMEEIAARCHISKRTLYRLFPNKTEVFGAIVDQHRQSMLALPGDYDDLPLEEALGRIFLVDIDEEAHRKRTEFIRLAILEGRQFRELAALLRQRGADKSRIMLIEWLEAQARRGRIEIEDAGMTAGILMDMMFGLIARKQERDAPRWPGDDDRRAVLRHTIRIFVNGVRRR
jgi:AcrR family transcriptional regulator